MKKEDGQAIVELAISLPILIMILCAIIDFGWLFMNQNSIDYAREGARYAIVHSSSKSAIEAHIRAIAPEKHRNYRRNQYYFYKCLKPAPGRCGN